MKNIKVGDTVRRINEDHNTMKVGDTGIVTKVESKFRIYLDCTSYDVSHDSVNLELVKSAPTHGQIKAELEALQKEFEQYKLESIKWSVEDFTSLQVNGYQISDEQAQDALEEMIRKHDCSSGISWDTVEYFVTQYGTEVPEGTESWREKTEQHQSLANPH